VDSRAFHNIVCEALTCQTLVYVQTFLLYKTLPELAHFSIVKPIFLENSVKIFLLNFIT